MFEDFCASNIVIEHKCRPGTIKICQVPHVKSGPHSTSDKKTEFNHLIENKFQKKKYHVVLVYEKIVQIDKYESLFYDEVHLLRSVKTLKNAIMEKVVPISILSPRIMSQCFSELRKYGAY